VSLLSQKSKTHSVNKTIQMKHSSKTSICTKTMSGCVAFAHNITRTVNAKIRPSKLPFAPNNFDPFICACVFYKYIRNQMFMWRQLSAWKELLTGMSNTHLKKIWLSCIPVYQSWAFVRTSAHSASMCFFDWRKKSRASGKCPQKLFCPLYESTMICRA
jgi:hypothetical protein